MTDPDQVARGEIVLYQAPDGSVALDVRLERESLWLTQKQMAELFGKDVRTINEHVGNVFSEGELERGATVRKSRIARQEGDRQVERDKSVISRHLCNVFREKELLRKATAARNATVQREGTCIVTHLLCEEEAA